MNNEINLKTAVDSLAKQSNGIWVPEVCGITQLQTQVPALVHRDMHSNSDQIRVLLVGGFSGQIADVEIENCLFLEGGEKKLAETEFHKKGAPGGGRRGVKVLFSREEARNPKRVAFSRAFESA